MEKTFGPVSWKKLPSEVGLKKGLGKGRLLMGLRKVPWPGTRGPRKKTGRIGAENLLSLSSKVWESFFGRPGKEARRFGENHGPGKFWGGANW